MNGLALPTLPKPSLRLRAEALLILPTMIAGVFGLVILLVGLLSSDWGVAGLGALGIGAATAVTLVAGTKDQQEVGARRAVLDAFADDLAAHYDVTYIERLKVADPGLHDGPREPVIVSVRTNADGTELALVAVTRDGRVAFYGGADSSAEYAPQRLFQAA